MGAVNPGLNRQSDIETPCLCRKLRLLIDQPHRPLVARTAASHACIRPDCTRSLPGLRVRKDEVLVCLIHCSKRAQEITQIDLGAADLPRE